MRGLTGRCLIALALSLILFAAVFVWDIPSSFAEEPPVESPSAVPTETAEPEPTETLGETPITEPESTATPIETPAPVSGPIPDVLPEDILLPESEMEPAGMMEPCATSGDYDYTDNGDGTVTITGYHGAGGDVTIPSTLGGKTVTVIGDNSFRDNDTLIRIVIPNSVTDIGDSAFYYCESLTSVAIGSSVKNIKRHAFALSGLTSLYIPSSVMSIESYVFLGCNDFMAINVDAANTIYSSENGVLYNKAKTVIMLFPEGKTDTVFSIPSGVTKVGDLAFDSNRRLTSVILPDSVTAIGAGAFYFCDSLTSVTFGSGIQIIGEDAFVYSGLTSLNIPASVADIGEGAFGGCSSLKSIDVASANLYYISENGVLFNKAKTNLLQYPAGKFDKVYTVPNGVVALGKMAFSSCQSININLPNSIANIGADAFINCSNLLGIRIPDNVTRIETNTFNGCSALIEVILPDSITFIGTCAFQGCYELRSIVIPRNVEYIEDWAFAYCAKLDRVDFYGDAPAADISVFYCCDTELVIYYDKTKIGYNNSWCNIKSIAYDKDDLIVRNLTAHLGTGFGYDYWVGSEGVTIFNYTGSDSSVIIPSQIEGRCIVNIGRNTYANNDRLTSVIIPNGVKRIFDRAFDFCKNLKNISIPEGVYRIGEAVFEGCSSLEALTLPSSLKVIGYSMCYNCPNLKYLSIPENVIRIEGGAFACCGITKIIIPKNVEFIGGSAFAQCTNLTYALFYGNAPEIGPPNMGYKDIGYDVFDRCMPNFTVFYCSGALGFTNPWHDYPTSVYDPSKYVSITFESQGGSTVSPISGEFGMTVNEPAEPTRQWYSFGGWFSTPECSSFPVTFPIVVPSNTTLYAKWYPANCSVQFVTFGGIGDQFEWASYGSLIDAPPTPSRYDQNFAGWYPTPAYDTEPISFPYTVKGNVMLFAKWQYPGPYISNMVISAGKINRAFYYKDKKYIITLGENEPSVTLSPDQYPGVSITINGKAVSGTTVTLANGKSKTVTIKVKYGKKSTTYKFTVSRAKSGDNNLASLTNSAGAMSQSFDPNVTNYTLSLDENTKSVALKAAKSNPMASVSPASKKLTLKNGQTKVVKFTVKAQSGAKKTYPVTVTRAPSTNTNLKTLKAGIPMSPGFNAGVTDYTVTLPADKESITISAKVFDRLSKVTIDGLKKSSKKVTLANGQSTTVSVVVTSQAGTVKEYRILVQRP